MFSEADHYYDVIKLEIKFLFLQVVVVNMRCHFS